MGFLRELGMSLTGLCEVCVKASHTTGTATTSASEASAGNIPMIRTASATESQFLLGKGHTVHGHGANLQLSRPVSTGTDTWGNP